MSSLVYNLNNAPMHKQVAAIERVKKHINKEIQNDIYKDFKEQQKKQKKNYLNHQFSKIMEIKTRWDLNEISNDDFMKFTKTHVMNCWAFKYMNKLRERSCKKIQKAWRSYKQKKGIIHEVIIESDYDFSDEENDPLENTIYNFKDYSIKQV